MNSRRLALHILSGLILLVALIVGGALGTLSNPDVAAQATVPTEDVCGVLCAAQTAQGGDVPTVLTGHSGGSVD